MTRSPFVDYDRVADRYRRGRALPPEVLDRWAAAVRPHLPSPPIRVADVGAGTGIFATVWPRWTAATVVAVEPSTEMIKAGDRAVRYVRGAAERLPLRDGSLDVAWLSTSLHHFADLGRAAAEIGRALRDDRRTEIGWWARFPGWSRATAKVLAGVYSVDQIEAVFGVHGFAVSHVCEVDEGTSTFAESADWVERMRHADSFLTALSDAEVDEGVRRLRAEPDRTSRNELSLVVLSRSG